MKEIVPRSISSQVQNDLQRVVRNAIEQHENQTGGNTMTRAQASMNDVGSDLEGIKLQYIFKRIDQLSQCISGKAATKVNDEIKAIADGNVVLREMVDYQSRLNRVTGNSLVEHFKEMMKGTAVEKQPYAVRNDYNNIVSAVREEMLYDMIDRGEIPFVKDLRQTLAEWNHSSKTWKAFFNIPANLGTRAKKAVNQAIRDADPVFQTLLNLKAKADTIQDIVRENGMLIKDKLISGELNIKDAPAILERFEQTDGGTSANLFE